ncbi:hypothetical protein [Rothia sp. 88186D007BW]
MGHDATAARIEQAVEADLTARPGVNRATGEIGDAILAQLRQRCWSPTETR